MKLGKLIIILISVALLTSAAMMLFYYFFMIVQVQEKDYFYMVGDAVGLAGDTDIVHFGTLPPGSVGSRFLVFENDFDFPVRVKITINGENENSITVEENNFILEEKENRTIRIIAIAPNYAAKGNYTGTIKAFYVRT